MPTPAWAWHLTLKWQAQPTLHFLLDFVGDGPGIAVVGFQEFVGFVVVDEGFVFAVPLEFSVADAIGDTGEVAEVHG